MPRVTSPPGSCPYCKDSLNHHWNHRQEPLVTFINGQPVHSGHCEAELLRISSKNQITGTVSPRDLTYRYRT